MMSDIAAFILIASAAIMAIELLYRIGSRDKDVRLLPRAIVVLGAAIVAYDLRPAQVEQMGTLDQAAAIVFCYGSMLLGMAAEYGYSLADRASRGEGQLKFDTATFLLPIFASPIIFIPLLTLTSELTAGGAFTRAHLMVYLVAFQNGFFWKQLFEQRRQAMATTSARVPAAVV
jgi:hypothetical protein